MDAESFLASPVVRQAQEYLEAEAETMVATAGRKILDNMRTRTRTNGNVPRRKFRKNRKKPYVKLNASTSAPFFNEDEQNFTNLDNTIRYWPVAASTAEACDEGCDEPIEWRSYFCKRDWTTSKTDTDHCTPNTPGANQIEHLAENVICRYEGATDTFLDQAGMVDTDTNITYAGEFANDMRNGYGTMLFPDGTRYDGTFTDNGLSGKGSFTWSDGSVYCGDVRNGYRHGRGKHVNALNGDCYVGEYRCGQRHGFGRMLFGGSTRNFYAGQWRYDKMHGVGVRRFGASGNVYKGEFEANEISGLGTMMWYSTNQVYRGYFAHGVQNGIGVHVTYFSNSPQAVPHDNFSSPSALNHVINNMYAGYFKNGHRHGPGIMQYANGQRYEGIYYWDMKHGQGFFVDETKVVHGLATNDHFVPYDGGEKHQPQNDAKQNAELPSSPSAVFGFTTATAASLAAPATTGRPKDAARNTGAGSLGTSSKPSYMYGTLYGRTQRIASLPAAAGGGSVSSSNTAPAITPIQYGVPIVVDNEGFLLNLPLVRALLQETENEQDQDSSYIAAVGANDSAIEQHREYLEVNRTAFRYMDVLKQVYSVYARAMARDDGSGVYVMRQYQFSLFVKDCFLSFRKENLPSILIGTSPLEEIKSYRPKSVAELELSSETFTAAISEPKNEAERPNSSSLPPHPLARIAFAEFIDRTCVVAHRICADIMRAQQQQPPPAQQQSSKNATTPPPSARPAFSAAAASLKFCVKSMIEPNAGSFRSILLASAASTKVSYFYITRLYKVLVFFYKLNRRYTRNGGFETNSGVALQALPPSIPKTIVVKELLMMFKSLNIVTEDDVSSDTTGGVHVSEAEFLQAVQDATAPVGNIAETTNNIELPLSVVECMEICILLANRMLPSNLFQLDLIKQAVQRANLVFEPLQEILHGAVPCDDEAIVSLCSKIQDITSRLPNAAAAAGAAAAAAAAAAQAAANQDKPSISPAVSPTAATVSPNGINKPVSGGANSVEINSDINPTTAWNGGGEGLAADSDDDDAYSTHCNGWGGSESSDILHRLDPLYYKNFFGIENEHLLDRMTDGTNNTSMLQVLRQAVKMDSQLPLSDAADADSVYEEARQDMFAKQFDNITRQLLAARHRQQENVKDSIHNATDLFHQVSNSVLASIDNEGDHRARQQQVRTNQNEVANLLPSVHIFSKTWLSTFEADPEQHRANLMALKIDYFFRHILLPRAHAYRLADKRLKTLQKRDAANYVAPTMADLLLVGKPNIIADATRRKPVVPDVTTTAAGSVVAPAKHPAANEATEQRHGTAKVIGGLKVADVAGIVTSTSQLPDGNITVTIVPPSSERLRIQPDESAAVDNKKLAVEVSGGGSMAPTLDQSAASDVPANANSSNANISIDVPFIGEA